MQPYILPYIGYYQLIKSVDVFVVYDNIKYTKKGWINRNRFLLSGRDEIFSLPLKAASDSLDICDRYISADFDSKKIINRFVAAYKNSPQFFKTIPIIERVLNFGEKNLFAYILFSLKEVCDFLQITTPIVVSSSLDVDHSLKGQDRVLEICRHLNAETYINSIGGCDLYSHEVFFDHGVDLKFLRPKFFDYQQFGGCFVPWLSVLDVMMFNSQLKISEDLIFRYDLVENKNVL